MSLADELIREQSADKTLLCYNPAFFNTEQNLALVIGQRLRRSVNSDIPRVRAWLTRFTNSRKVELSPHQQEAVEIAAYSKIAVLTGGPGTGKTFSVRTIVELWKAMGKSIALAAPTGRAAQRLTEMTGLEAKTVHRLLEFDPRTMGFKRDMSNPLPQKAVIVDEASMLDLFLAYSLIKAVPEDGQILFVGDIDQLPSVGPGSVLADLIKSDRIPVVRLTQVFRQAQSSAIIRSAHQINQGHYPNIEPISNAPTAEGLHHVLGSVEGTEDSVEYRLAQLEEQLNQLSNSADKRVDTDVDNRLSLLEQKLEAQALQLAKIEGVITTLSQQRSHTGGGYRRQSFNYHPPQLELQPYTGENLAKRLGVDIATLTRERENQSESEFEIWCRRKDPSPVGWRFNSKDGKYHPVK